MTDKEKQNICKSELYEACLKLHCELSAYTDSLLDLSELVGECFMPAPIADPEVSDYIERCFHVSSGYSYRAKDLLGMLDAYINQCLKDAEIKDLTTYVEQSKRFMKSISENYPSEGDIQNLKNMIVECIMIVNRLCSQKWQGGESGFRIDTVGSLEERHKQLSGLIERVKYLLNRYIDELFVTMKREISMACVYASPEVMTGTSPMFSPIKKDQTYPYIHSFSDTFSDDKDDALMEVIYGSPQMIEEYQRSLERNRTKSEYKYCVNCGNKISNGNTCSSCGKKNIDADPEETVRFCPKCAATIPMIARYCSYCGCCLRGDTVSDTPEASMACVYASPEMNAIKKQKKGFLNKLFKRND